MKKNLILTLTSLLLVLLATGCDPDAPDSSDALTAPTVDEVFANYAAIGNSLTAGFMDGGLMYAGQMSSFPRLIAGQLGLANAPGDMEFSQPWINPPGIASTSAPPGQVAGVYYLTGTGGLGVLGYTDLTAVQTDLLAAVSQPTPYHNLGVPGAALYDVLNAYSSTTCGSYVNFESANPYFDFVNRASLFGNITVPATAVSPAYQSASMFGQCVAKGPSLATVWIGNNDVLGGATSGTVIDGVTVTDAATFDGMYKQMLTTFAGGLLARTGWPATIAVANIPDIEDIPYFWPVAVFNATLPEALGGSWPPGFEEDDVALVRFPVANWLATADPATDLIPAGYTLTAAEVQIVQDNVAAYNTTIEEAVGMVNALGLAQCGLVDTNALMAGLPAGQKTHLLLLLGQGYTPTEAAATTLFSLDGIHPNNRGYAVVADEFLEKIGEMTGQTFDLVPAQTWDPTYSAYQAAVGKQVQPGPLDAMENLFR